MCAAVRPVMRCLSLSRQACQRRQTLTSSTQVKVAEQLSSRSRSPTVNNRPVWFQAFFSNKHALSLQTPLCSSDRFCPAFTCCASQRLCIKDPAADFNAFAYWLCVCTLLAPPANAFAYWLCVCTLCRSHCTATRLLSGCRLQASTG